MRWGDLLVEAKLTENDFQIREASIVETYRDLEEVFDIDLLPRVFIRARRRRDAIELTEEFTQEWEAPSEAAEEVAREFHASIESRADAAWAAVDDGRDAGPRGVDAADYVGLEGRTGVDVGEARHRARVVGKIHRALGFESRL